MLIPWSRSVVLLGAVVLAPACSGSDSSNTKAAVAQPSALRAAAVDSQTAMRAELTQLLQRSEKGLSARPAPGGGTAVDLDGRYASAAVARLNADGSVSSECFDDVEGAVEFAEAGHQAQPEVK